MLLLLVQGRGNMATILDISPGGLILMEQRGLPVHLKAGTEGIIYHLPSVIKWLKADWARQHVPAPSTAALDVRRKTADARKVELEVEKLEGTVLDIELIRRGLEGVMINMRTILLSLPSQIGRDLEDPATRGRIVSIADRCVREALGVISAYDPIIAPHTDGAGEDDAGDQPAPDQSPTQAQHQSVGRAKKIPQPRRRGQRQVEK